MGLVDAGKLRVIATSGSKRWDAFPSIPALAEVGLPDATATAWSGVIVPAATPDAAVAKLNAAFNTALKSDVIKSRMAAFGASPIFDSTPADFLKLVRSETTLYEPIIKRVGISFE